MHAVVLTFPGHFFQTQLCLRNLRKFFPEITNITFVLDDVDAMSWTSFAKDFYHTATQALDIPYQMVMVSSMPAIKQSVSGWWRQQLVKLTLDTFVADDCWFLVDGDVIFQTRCDIKQLVPICRKLDDSRWNKMAKRYTQDLLSLDQGGLWDGNAQMLTSPVPFRYLDRQLLQSLRSTVEQKFKRDFVDLHLEWFQNQTIVADIDPPDRWVMSEWELIECYRRYVLNQTWPFVDIGSGYPIDVKFDASMSNFFFHSYQRDAEIGHTWFASQGLAVDTATWEKSTAWYKQYKQAN